MGSPCQRRAARRLPESAFRAVAVSVGFGGEVYLFVRQQSNTSRANCMIRAAPVRTGS